jgi:tetratricopeptide (TPR) repeat protein
LRYARTQFGVIAHYLRLAFVPYPLCADYFWRPADTMERILPPALLIGGLVLATCWALWRYPAWGFLGAAFFLLLGPSSSFIPIEDIATERRMYLPLAALIALLVFGVWEFLGYLERSNQAAAVQPVDSRSSFFGAVLLAVVLTVWGGLTILRNFDYSDDIDFCELMARQNPVNSRARVNLARGLILKAEREPLPAVRDAYYTEALKYLAEAEVSAPRSAFVQSQIGHILSQQREIERLLRRPGWQTRRASHLEEAERRFRKAVDLYPNYALFRLNLATVLEQKGTPAALDEALEQFQQAADIGRRTEHVIPESHYGLARMLRDHNRLRESVPQFEETLRLDSRQVKAQLDLASVLFQLSRVPNAIAAAEDALRKAEALGDAQDAEDARRLIQGFRTSQPTTQASKSATQGSK